jgi:hypothetical protein
MQLDWSAQFVETAAFATDFQKKIAVLKIVSIYRKVLAKTLAWGSLAASGAGANCRSAAS